MHYAIRLRASRRRLTRIPIASGSLGRITRFTSISCLILTGTSLAIFRPFSSIRRHSNIRGALAGVAAAVGIAVIYTTVFRLFESMGNVSQLPPILAAWAPDLIFGLAGGYLILKVPT